MNTDWQVQWAGLRLCQLNFYMIPMNLKTLAKTFLKILLSCVDPENIHASPTGFFLVRTPLPIPLEIPVLLPTFLKNFGFLDPSPPPPLKFPLTLFGVTWIFS